MTAEQVKHKVAAILIANVKGYSRLMGEDEAWATRTLDTYKEILIAHIQKHTGRLVDAVGDNLVAEFDSAFDAVRCAVDVQKELKTRNAQLPENRRMELRIGVNVGDVIEEGDKISGDAVNITSKMESLSTPGGVCISGAVYDYVSKKLVLRYEYLGAQSVRSSEKPVRIYRVLIEPKGFVSRLSIWKGKALKQWEALNPVVKVIIALVALGNGVWQIYPLISGFPLLSKVKITTISPENSTRLAKSDPSEVAYKERKALPLPDKPSIAVLPLANATGDPKYENLCDGLTDEIINSLGRSSQLLVIARNSTFIYKGKPVKVQQVSEQMGVRYVLEGNVQASEGQVRVSAHLIDALQGYTLFSERYETKLKNIFFIQDEITLKVLGAMHVKLTTGEEARVFANETRNLEAYLKLMEARNLNLTFNKVNLVRARQLAEEAISLDPKYALAYSSLAMIIRNAIQMGAYKDPDSELKHGMEMAKKGVSLNEALGYPHTVLGQYYCMMNRDFEKAVSEAERAMSLDPSSPTVIQNSGAIFLMAGRYEDALRAFITATRLSPIPNPTTQCNLASSYRWLGKYEEALKIYRRNLQTTPNHMQTQLGVVATLMLMGNEKEARMEAEKVLAMDSNFSLEAYAKVFRQTYKNQEDAERLWIGPLRKAGLK